jgi:arylsulfate sulfotransferase
VNTLDLRTVLQRSRYTGFLPEEHPDWLHLNTITWVEGTNDIPISSRHQSVVARISWPEGKIKWLLGIHDRWLPMFQKYLLTPTGANFEWQFNQHAPEILPDQDNNPDTMDILLFDNGNQRYDFDAELQRQIAAHEIVPPELYSRMVQFRVDEKNMTVSQIWEFGKELGSEVYSPARGDANLLPNGNRLGAFDVQTNYDPMSQNDRNNNANSLR